MNPFNIDKPFNSNLYEDIKNLQKGDKWIIKSLTNIINLPDLSFDPLILIDHISSNNKKIRNLVSDIIYKYNISNFTVLSHWFIQFTIDPSYNTDKLIFKKINLTNLSDTILSLLDFKNIHSIKILCLLIKQNDNINIRNYTKYFKYNNNIYLKYIYNILIITGPITEIKKNIISISGSVLVNYKYKILLLYKYIPISIYDEGVFLEDDVFNDVIKFIKENNYNYKISKDFNSDKNKKNDDFFIQNKEVKDMKIENLKVFNMTSQILNENKINKNNDYNFKQVNLDKFCDIKIEEIKIITTSKLCMILPNINDKYTYLQNNLKNIKDKVNLLKILDIDVLDKILGVSEVTEIILLYLNTFIDKFSSENTIDFNLDSIKKIAINDETLKNPKIYKKNIKRACILDYKLDIDDFTEDEIIENIKYSIDIFSKDELFRKIKFCNSDVLICKYPEEFDNVEINYENIEKLSKIFKFKKDIKQYLSTNLNILDKINLDKTFDLFILNIKFKTGLSLKQKYLRIIDYEELVNEYLEFHFIKYIKEFDIFDNNLFNTAIFKFISNFKIPVTTEYNNEFYTKIEYFYKNIKKFSVLKEIDEIRKIYLSCFSLSNKINVLILDLVNEILCVDNFKEFDDLKNDCNNSTKLNYSTINKTISNSKNSYDYNFQDNETDTLNESVNKINIDEFNYYNNEDITSKIELIKEIFSNSHNKYFLYKVLNINVKNSYVCHDILNKKNIDLMMIEEKIDPYNVDFCYLSRKSLKKAVNLICCNFIIDKVLNLLKKYLHIIICHNVHSLILDKISEYFKDEILNIYSNLNNDAEEEDLYYFLISEIPKNCNLFDIIIMESLMKIRDLNIIFLFSKFYKFSINNIIESKFDNLNHQNKIYFEFYNSNKNLNNFYSNIYKKYQFIFNRELKDFESVKMLLYNESQYILDNVSVKYFNTSNNITIKFQFQEFTATIIYSSKISFSTNVEKKSMINHKINNLLSKTCKFMEIINLWKKNITRTDYTECMICYFILHIVDGTFPKYSCIHCNAKYHSKCIYKWKNGDKNRMCPVCRKEILIY